MSRTSFWSDVSYLKSPTCQALLTQQEKVALESAIRDMNATSMLTNATTATQLVSHLVQMVAERLQQAKNVMLSRTKLGFNYGR